MEFVDISGEDDMEISDNNFRVQPQTEDQFQAPKMRRPKGNSPYLTDTAIRWQEQVLGQSLLESIKSTHKFDRYFDVSSKLLEHPRTKNVKTIYSHGGKKTFQVYEEVLINGTIPKRMARFYPGIGDVAQQTFFPDTSDNPIEKAARNKTLGDGKKVVNGKEIPKGRKPLNKIHAKDVKHPCSKSGAQHGTLVHNQFERMTKIINGTANFNYYYNKKEILDQCTINLVNYFIKKSWLPIRSEFVIYDEDIEMCTAIDLILVSIKDWTLIAVELKTGYESEEYGIHPNDVKFPPPLEKITNCPLNRHWLKHLIEDIVLDKKYRIRADAQLLVRMCPKYGIIEIYEPSNWCLIEEYREIIYQTLLARKK
jgi:hypothetical protein